MTKEQWKTIKHFNPKEKWGDPEKMDYRLVWMLDRLREKIGKPIIIHCGYATDGHAENSYHYKGQAVDFHVEGGAFNFHEGWKSVTLEFRNRRMDRKVFFMQEKFWFLGLGIYPHWNNPGFHLDLGPARSWWQNAEGGYNDTG